MTGRNGGEWWGRLPDRLVELAAIIPGVVVFGLGCWVIFGAVR